MALTQQFVLFAPSPGLPAEWVCAGCQAPMTEVPPTGDNPVDAVTMNHSEQCPEIAAMQAQQR